MHEEDNMSAGLGPHKATEPGYIVAWRSKNQFRAGKYLDEVMTYGAAHDKAETLSAKNSKLTFWAEHEPQKFEPH
jgi:hypothetical protein